MSLWKESSVTVGRNYGREMELGRLREVVDDVELDQVGEGWT